MIPPPKTSPCFVYITADWPGATNFWGGSTVFGRYVLKSVSFQAMTAIRFIAALFFLFLIQAWYGRLGEIGSATGKDWLYVFIIAVLAGLVSLFIYYRGLKNTKASIATLAELAFPLSAVVVNWIFLDAKLELGQIAGGLILLYAITKLSLVNTFSNSRELENGPIGV